MRKKHLPACHAPAFTYSRQSHVRSAVHWTDTGGNHRKAPCHSYATCWRRIHTVMTPWEACSVSFCTTAGGSLRDRIAPVCLNFASYSLLLDHSTSWPAPGICGSRVQVPASRKPRLCQGGYRPLRFGRAIGVPASHPPPPTPGGARSVGVRPSMLLLQASHHNQLATGPESASMALNRNLRLSCLRF